LHGVTVTKTAEVERGSGECKAQLSGVTDGDANPYYVNGDWHDVFYQPAQVEAEYAYFSVDNHQARVTICHNPFSINSC
jgi:hypothetical protein